MVQIRTSAILNRAIFRVAKLGHGLGDQVRSDGEEDEPRCTSVPSSHAANFTSPSFPHHDVPGSSTPAYDVSRSAQATAPSHALLSSLLLLNARSLNPSANSVGRWKLNDLIGHVEENRESGHLFPFIAITESWLKSY